MMLHYFVSAFFIFKWQILTQDLTKIRIGLNDDNNNNNTIQIYWKMHAIFYKKYLGK